MRHKGDKGIEGTKKDTGTQNGIGQMPVDVCPEAACVKAWKVLM